MKNILAVMALAAATVIAPLGMSAPSQAGVNINVYVNPGPGRISCREAANRLYYRGYNRVQAFDCQGSVYRFEARRYYRWWIIDVSARSGRILNVH